MQDVSEARRFTINALDKAYTDIKVFVNDLVKKSNDHDNMSLIQVKLDNLELYINTLKALDKQPVRGGRKTRKNRRKSLRH